MSCWYNNQQKFLLERAKLAEAHPLLRLVVAPPGFVINNVLCLGYEWAIVHGTYELSTPDLSGSIDYQIVVGLPNDYPKSPPVLLCNDPKLPIGNIDRHIMSDGQACLGVHAEIGIRWSAGSTILDFLQYLVRPFLVWQAYHDLHGEAPPWGERAHSKVGIISFYKEVMKIEDDTSIPAFMALLARKNQPKGHEPCPCGSGKKLRNCHRKTIDATRKMLMSQDVQKDITALAYFSKSIRAVEICRQSAAVIANRRLAPLSHRQKSRTAQG